MGVKNVLDLILGLVFFLYGMTVLSNNLEKMAGGKLEAMLKSATSKPLFGLALGAGITIAIQSSSATTVMLVGLVNSGIMQFSQTMSVIFGANIGTTLTAWILSLSGLKSEGGGFSVTDMLKPEYFSPIIALIGIGLVMMAKSDKKKSIGTIFIGFAVLMFGMTLMSSAVSPLRDVPEFQTLLREFGKNPILGVLVGAIFTALIQSSAASVAILQSLANAGGITYGMAIPIVMGQNIGTCITSVLSCIGTNSNAKRVSVLHVAVNTIGTVMVLIIYFVLMISGLPFFISIMGNDVTAAEIALIHTIFNVFITVTLMPCSKWIIKLAEKIIKDKETDEDKKKVAFTLDERLLQSPSVAINECRTFAHVMAEKACSSLKDSLMLLDSYDESKVDEIRGLEKELDSLEDALGSYLVKISSFALSREDSRRVSKMLHTIGDFERMGDHSVNIMRAAKEMHDKGVSFSADAKRELAVLISAVGEILDLTLEAYSNNDTDLAFKVEPLEQVIDNVKAQIKENHIERLQRGECTIELGFILGDLLTDFERISDHCSNVAVAVIELIHGRFDTHKYLSGVKKGSEEFFEEYREFGEKYVLN